MPLKGHPFEFISSLPSAVAMKDTRTELRTILSYFIMGRLNSALEASQFPGDFPGDQNQCSGRAVTLWLSRLQARGDRGTAGSKVSIKYH